VLFASIYLLAMQVQQQGFRPYFASPVTTPMLVEACKGFVATAPETPANFCSGYILSAYDQLAALRQICAPAPIGPVQIVAIVTNYLRAHPQQWNKHPNALVKTAFQSVIPCR
jgi:hypothetical protein